MERKKEVRMGERVAKKKKKGINEISRFTSKKRGNNSNDGKIWCNADPMAHGE